MDNIIANNGKRAIAVKTKAKTVMPMAKKERVKGKG
jgi:hypothetical protein